MQQLMSRVCLLFLGESSSCRFATERSSMKYQSIFPFTFWDLLNQGHGLLARFVFIFPMCLCPTTTKTEVACPGLRGSSSKCTIFTTPLHHPTTLSPNPLKQHHIALKDDFTQKVNNAIRDGNVPPKSKRIDFLQRVSVFLHVSNLKN